MCIIVILGSNCLKILNKRLKHSVAIIENNPNSSIIVSGGSKLKNNMEESFYMAEWIYKRFPTRLVLMENQSIDTVTNLIYVRRMIFEKNLSSRIIFITSFTHQDRVFCLANFLFKNFKISSSPDLLFKDTVEAWAIERDTQRMQLFIKNGN